MFKVDIGNNLGFGVERSKVKVNLVRVRVNSNTAWVLIVQRFGDTVYIASVDIGHIAVACDSPCIYRAVTETITPRDRVVKVLRLTVA